jgi:hypothetical protein
MKAADRHLQAMKNENRRLALPDTMVDEIIAAGQLVNLSKNLERMVIVLPSYLSRTVEN